MEELFKEIIEKYKSLPERSFIGNGYELYDKSRLIDDIDKLSAKIPTMILGEKHDESSDEYHEYYKKYVILIALFERLANDIKHSIDYISYPKGTKTRTIPRD